MNCFTLYPRQKKNVKLKIISTLSFSVFILRFSYISGISVSRNWNGQTVIIILSEEKNFWHFFLYSSLPTTSTFVGEICCCISLQIVGSCSGQIQRHQQLQLQPQQQQQRRDNNLHSTKYSWREKVDKKLWTRRERNVVKTSLIISKLFREWK